MNKGIIIVAILLIVSIIIGYYYYAINTSQQAKTITIFNAGSLTIPLEKLAKIYTEKTGVNVQIVPSGSLMVIRKVTELHENPDIVAVADYRLIKYYLYPNYTKWYIAFATNQVVLVFTKHSKYADELEKNPSKWYEILARPDVKWGFSNPNDDPCGYRAVGIIGLATLYYHNTTIIDSLLARNTNIKYRISDGKIEIYVPQNLTVHNNLVIRPKSVDLISLLESGQIDYAFEYKSVAVQHNLSYIELPPQLNLGDPSQAGFYAKSIVYVMAGTSQEKPITMAPILYGITILDNAKHYQEALKYVEMLLGSTGREIFSQCGQKILEHPLIYGNPPEEIRRIAG